MSALVEQICRSSRGAIALSVRLTPKGGQDKIEGTFEGPGGITLKVRVAAVPEKGKANAALEKLLADWLDVPKSSVNVSAGQSSRLKTVTISGDPEVLKANVASRLTCLP